MRVEWRVAGVLIAVVALGCGPSGRGGRGDDSRSDDTGDGGSSGQVCAPASSIACTCDGGAAGTATCVADGSRYGVCNCSGAIACTPLATEACTCPSGATGVATCLADGSRFDVCVCTPLAVCAPGTTATCSCPNGPGTERCLSDGTGYGACACPTGCGGETHDGGDGECVPVGTCSPGYVLDGADCVAAGGCAPGEVVAHLSAPSTVQVGGTVHLDASESRGHALSYSWNVTAPTGATSALAAVATPTFVAEAAGSYAVALTVTDEVGCGDTTTASVVATGTTGSGGTGTSFRLVLNWVGTNGEEIGDIDLHMLGPPPSGVTAKWFDTGTLLGIAGLGGNATDCYFGDATPDWGLNHTTAADSATTDDPAYTAPATSWGGVSQGENLTMPAWDGSFRVGAEYWCSRRESQDANGNTVYATSSSGPVVATLKVYGAASTPIATFTSPPLVQRDLWEGARIQVSGARITASSTNLVSHDFQDIPATDQFGLTGASAGCTQDAN